MAKHSLILTYASAHLLANLITTPGLLTDIPNISRCGEFNETALSDLPSPLAKDAPEAEQKAWVKTELAAIEITERTRESLKALITAAIGKGMLGGHTTVLQLIRQLGLTPDA